MNHNILTTIDKNTGFNVSNKYQVINTQDLINNFTSQGYQLSDLKLTKVKNQERQGYQKHMLRLRHPDFKISDEAIPEILIINSYDGTSSFKISLGIYRLVCANGLILGNTFESHNVRHVGNNIFNNVLVAAEKLRLNQSRIIDTVNKFSKIELTNVKRAEFAHEAIKIINNDDSIKCVNPEQILKPRRYYDAKIDLWSVFNVVQENIIKGGTRLFYKQKDSMFNELKTLRAIKSIDRLNQVNRDLFDLAEQFAA